MFTRWNVPSDINIGPQQFDSVFIEHNRNRLDFIYLSPKPEPSWVLPVPCMAGDQCPHQHTANLSPWWLILTLWPIPPFSRDPLYKPVFSLPWIIHLGCKHSVTTFLLLSELLQVFAQNPSTPTFSGSILAQNLVTPTKEKGGE